MTLINKLLFLQVFRCIEFYVVITYVKIEQTTNVNNFSWINVKLYRQTEYIVEIYYLMPDVSKIPDINMFPLNSHWD